MAAMENDPRFWLKNGPGRDVPGKPGWAAMVRPILTANQQTINLFTSPDFLRFLATLRAVLEPFPEALQAITDAMAKREPLTIEPTHTLNVDEPKDGPYSVRPKERMS
jgi:hypothetical protein